MKHATLELELIDTPGNELMTSALDFVIGSISLSRHLGITQRVGALSVCPSFGKQLLGKEPSRLPSGRIPLYVCGCCGDLGCGAISVDVEHREDVVIWRDFGLEASYQETFSQTDYMRRTGPFSFSKVAYVSLIKPYAS